MRYHQPTRDYVDRKTKEGKGKMEIIRCLKRFIAREAYRALISIRTGATPIGEPPAERGTRNLPELERRATLWIQTITIPNQPNQRAETLDNV